MPLPFYNINTVVSKTDFGTQSQSVIFSAKGFMYPGGPGEILQLPLGPGSSETPQFMTVYNIVTGGVVENPAISLPQVGDEIAVTGIDAASGLYAGTWRIIADPEVNTGGEGFHNLDNIVFKVVRI